MAENTLFSHPALPVVFSGFLHLFLGALYIPSDLNPVTLFLYPSQGCRNAIYIVRNIVSDCKQRQHCQPVYNRPV